MKTFHVPGMSCGHCKASVERAIAAVDADAQITVNLSAREVTVQSQATTEALIATMKSEGYEARLSH